jgi:hypothetical protein
MTEETQADWPMVEQVAAVFLACQDGMTRDDALPMDVVVRGAHIAWLEMTQRVVGPVNLVEWLRNSADVIESRFLVAEPTR